MNERCVTYELKGQIAFIGLNRPEKRNAINRELFLQLAEAVAKAEEEANVGVIFGHGSQFSSGLDLAFAADDLLKMDPALRKRRPDLSRIAFDSIARGVIPWIAALHGPVVGAGFELAATAHVRVADETAFFALPECARGIFVGGGGSVRIQRLIGTSRMTDMMLTSRTYSAQDAEGFGAVQYLVAPGEALAKASELAQKIAGNAALSNYAVSAIMPRIADMPVDEGLFYERVAAEYIITAESSERMRAFLEKRSAPLERPANPGKE
ncbi:crotonase/enoyl-CoA hydratase family protein [Sphingobium sp. MK2]|uniref:crotonase/enoyl-CoA hydratase family protein n=1 Tax=Sphingobium sp. MK2 TaxID=3116540 RepID=UPI0032E35B97